MTDETRRQYEALAGEILSYESIAPDAIPNIDIYMDQLTTFMDGRLRAQTRNPAGDKVLTKTMINNYTKNDLLPPPVKKKYTREHLILLIYIFYFKNSLSMNDISTLIAPLKELFANDAKSVSLDDVYDETISWCKQEAPHVRQDMDRLYRAAEETFLSAPDQERDDLQRFAFLAMLAYDVYMKQTMIERMLDKITAPEDEPKKTDKNKKKKDTHD